MATCPIPAVGSVGSVEGVRSRREVSNLDVGGLLIYHLVHVTCFYIYYVYFS